MCWKCGQKIQSDSPVVRSSLCDYCGSDLHSCRNCRFYSPGAHYDCRETVDEQVRDKEQANFCGFFQPAAGFTADPAHSDDRQQQRRAFESLFGDG